MWPTEYVELKHIDELLHCGICYEYINTSVITSCSHNYCSLCIRKYLHYKTQCPICSEETFEGDLRKNKLLDDIIVQYLHFKEKHNKKFHREKLSAAKDDNSDIRYSENNFECQKDQDLNAIEISSKSCDSPTLAASNTTPRERKDFRQDVSTPSTSADPKIPLMFTPKSRKIFQKEEDCQIVICPVCKVEVSQNNINKHLDDCLKRENTKEQPKTSKTKRKPLPKLVLSLMKDNVIRKKLKELGLLSQGDRKALEGRLQRYTILYNAECDKTYPRPISELIKQCEEEENLEKKVQKSSNRLNVNRNTEHNVIDQQRKKYLTTNKDSFDRLITKIKHDDKYSQKMSVRRNILSKENSDILHNDHAIENDSVVKDNQKTDFLPLNSIRYIEDSDSNTSCSLQTYSSENPMNFLTIELKTSSDDFTDQYAPNSDSLNSIKTDNIKSEKLSSESSLINTFGFEEITFNNRSRQCNVLENEMDVDTKRSVSELEMEIENEEQSKLHKKNKSDMKYSAHKYITDSEPEDGRQKELRNKDVDLIVEDTEHFVEDNDNINIQKDYERSKELNNTMEEYVSGSTKFEKENMKTLNKDQTTWTHRKREHEMAFALRDEEKIADRPINARKSFRLGLSEAKGFNNENFDEIVRDEEKSQNEKEQSQVIRTNNFMRKSVRLRNKIKKKKL